MVLQIAGMEPFAFIWIIWLIKTIISKSVCWEIDFLEAHLFRELLAWQILILNIHWGWLFIHCAGQSIAVRAVLALAQIIALYPACKAWTIFFVALCFFACAKLFLSFSGNLDTIFHGFYRFSSFLRIYFIAAILASAKGSANPIVLKAFAVRFKALTVFAAAKLSPISHEKGILHLYTRLTALIFHTYFVSSLKTRAFLRHAIWIALASMAYALTLLGISSGW